MSVMLAAILGGSLYFSMQGAILATNILIGILSINIALVAFYTPIVIGFQKSILMDAKEKLAKIEETSQKVDIRVLILLRVFLLVCVWHLYMMGYVLFAGIAGTTAVISLLISVFRAMDMLEIKK